METPNLTEDRAAWQLFVHLAFISSLGMMCIGVYLLPVTAWIKGYLGMGLFFLISSTITMTKAVRDRHEQRKIVNRDLRGEGGQDREGIPELSQRR